MKVPQYTIRNVPEQVDKYLRKRARLSGQSLNQVVLQELSERAGLHSSDLVDSLSWFIGGDVIGNDVMKTLKDDDKVQKELTRQQWQHDN